MLGLIPKVVWQRTVPIDEKNRMTLEHNCLLLERVDGAGVAQGATTPRRMLLEVGTGDKLDEKSRELFAMDGRSILTALAEEGVTPESIDAVTVSHLHFDHAGALTRAVRPGETADWTGPASTFAGPRGELGVKRTFPNARVYVQRREWRDAMANRSVMTRTYFADHLMPLLGSAHGGEGATPTPRAEVVLVDSPPPFAPGMVPDRADAPVLPQEVRETEVAPGVFVFLVPGHTWGQQATRFVDDQGRSIVFTPDVLPTVHHVGQAYSLAYDVEPYTSMITRTWLLETAAERGWLLFLDHEPGHPLRAVKRNGKGWYELPEVR